MELPDVEQLFGAAAPTIVVIAGLFLACVILVALVQGRSIEFWPPKIGSRPGPDPAEQDKQEKAALSMSAKLAGEQECREYTTSQAREFYDQAAPSYDLRSSGSNGLMSTHLDTVTVLEAIRDRKGTTTLRVCDLGGGTGKCVAIHFYNSKTIEWDYVDISPAMAREFRRNLAGFPLLERATVMVDDLIRRSKQLTPASYDVVLLSLVLSSMPALPDFTPIAQLLAPGGSLIITDISPSYTLAKPLYQVGPVALKTTLIDPLELVNRAKVAGLRPTELKPIGEGNGCYSFMMVFASQPLGVVGCRSNALSSCDDESSNQLLSRPTAAR